MIEKKSTMPTSSCLKVGLPRRNEEYLSRREMDKGEGGRAGTALAHPPTTPIPHARPGVGYICGLWVLQGRYNSQSKRANADCAK